VAAVAAVRVVPVAEQRVVPVAPAELPEQQAWVPLRLVRPEPQKLVGRATEAVQIPRGNVLMEKLAPTRSIIRIEIARAEAA
jgi:hypothetical protein